jgi:hypothetical protein
MASKLDFDKMPESVATEPKEETKAEVQFEESKTKLLPFELKDKKRVVLQITSGARYDQMTGEKISEDFIQTYTLDEFEQFKAHGEALGYTYIVRYMPPTNKK